MSFLSVTLESCSPPLVLFRSLSLYSPSFRASRIALPPPHHASASSQRLSNFHPGSGNNFVHDPRAWKRPITDDDDDDDVNDDNRSLDLLVRFLQNVFKKVSKRATKAVRSVLPFPISTKLVGFSVNGVLVLAFLWILKAFLEVICTLGSVVFVSILLIRGIWSSVSFLQESRNQKMDELHVDHDAWNGAQPVT